MTDAQYIQLVVAEVGDDATGALASTVPIYWARREMTDSELRFLLVKRDAIDLMLGRVRSQVTIRDGDGASVDLNKLFDHLTTMRESVEGLIVQRQGGGALTMVAASYGVTSVDEFGQPVRFLS